MGVRPVAGGASDYLDAGRRGELAARPGPPGFCVIAPLVKSIPLGLVGDTDHYSAHRNPAHLCSELNAAEIFGLERVDVLDRQPHRPAIILIAMEVSVVRIPIV